ncbi:hypothetical protein [Acinetobacter sp. SA01]|uniref:hypothetical protein n=1 Tax=Acinetobacter sp. SA01 TaxID=1862567 RepID=UPI00140E5023|nr:hypothetical protein [Acinetobacter sp. SA01]
MTVNKKKLKDELLKEKHLFNVYFSARAIPFSKKNKILLIVFAFLSLFLSYGIPSNELYEKIFTLSSSLIGTVVTVTGFLIAGYTIFCSVVSPKLSILLFSFGKTEHGLSELKRAHLSLIRVFIYCLFYTSVLVTISAFSGTHNFIYFHIESSFSFSKNLFYIINYLTFNFILIFFFFLVIQLGSFIYNIYHTIMMTIVAYPDLYKFKIGEPSDKENPP